MATTLPKTDRKSRTIRSRPRLEPLEDRLAPAVLEVVGSGGNGTTTFDTFAQAYNASTSPSDVIQLEPSAGDVGSIAFLDPNKAATLQGDPNFAVGSASEAVDNSTYGGVNFIHLWFSGMLDPGANAYVYGCHLNGLAMQNGDTLSHDDITGSIIIGGSQGFPPPGPFQILNCDFKPGSQVQITRASRCLISACIFEPSPTTGLILNGGDALIKDSSFSLTSDGDVLQLNNSFSGVIADFEQDDIHSHGGNGMHLESASALLNVLAQGTAFQGNRTAVFANLAGAIPGSDVDAGGGGKSIGGNEFLVNMITAINLTGSSSTLPVSVNDNVIGPGVTPVAGAASAEPVNQGMNLTPSQAFVEGLYHVYLLHTPTLDELNGWVSRLPSLGNSGVSQLIAHSQEALTRIVDNLYQQLLGRSADPGGEAAFVNFLGNGGTEEQAIEGMLSSAEFAARANGLAGTPGSSANLNFVRSLYAVLLGRSNETAAEDNAWLNALGAAGKIAVVAGFLQGPEFRGDYVASLYTSYTSLPGDSFFGAVPNLLCRPAPPAPSEVASWVNSGLSVQQIAVFMSASSEFFSDR
jgi:hypothetical protein